MLSASRIKAAILFSSSITRMADIILSPADSRHFDAFSADALKNSVVFRYISAVLVNENGLVANAAKGFSRKKLSLHFIQSHFNVKPVDPEILAEKC